MGTITVKRTIEAPADLIFKTISDIRQFSKAVPDIVRAEITSDVKSGVGTRFRETRMMSGKEATTEMEVREYVENDRVRIVADTHGTVWDSLFTVRPAGQHTELELTMDARPYKLLPKLMTSMARGMLKKALERDMDAVKAYCENHPA